MSALREGLEDLPDAAFADLLESDEAYLLVVDIPGATPESTVVEFEDGGLLVEADAEKDIPEGFRFHSEGRDDGLAFELPLPGDVEPDDANASVDRGVLEVRLPRSGSEETHIEVDES